jgi:RpiB/LacA/LacB family sugar-phosphate isomerase
MKKYNLLIPIAGKGSRFVEKGYILPKCLIMVGHKQSIDWSMESVNYEDCNLIFCAKKEHIENFGIDKILKKKYGDITVVEVTKDTGGSVETCLLAEKYIDNDIPLFIYTLDTLHEPKFNPAEHKLEDGFVLTFKSNSKDHSYVKVNEQGYAIETAEKQVISNNASVGIYYFRTGKMFMKYAKEMIEKNYRFNNEFYICPLYNLMIRDGLKVTIKDVDKIHVIGTPNDVHFFKKYVLKTFGEKPIALSSDHSGFEAKEKMKSILDEYQIKYIDFGTYTDKDCDYSDYIPQAADAILEGTCNFGIGFCRTGQGVNMNANKIKGIKSALLYDLDSAKFAMLHNGANFFAIPAKLESDEYFINIIEILKYTKFEGGRHSIRLAKIDKNE